MISEKSIISGSRTFSDDTQLISFLLKIRRSSQGSSPDRILRTSSRLSTPYTSVSFISMASAADLNGRMAPLSPSSLASSTSGRAPGISLTEPSSPSSPIIMYSPSSGRSLWPEAAIIPKAMGTSYPLPFLCMSAGARFITIFLPGILNPIDCKAVIVLNRLSFTAASARPTR